MHDLYTQLKSAGNASVISAGGRAGGRAGGQASGRSCGYCCQILLLDKHYKYQSSQDGQICFLPLPASLSRPGSVIVIGLLQRGCGKQMMQQGCQMMPNDDNRVAR
jgi:hypothetical protein